MARCGIAGWRRSPTTFAPTVDEILAKQKRPRDRDCAHGRAGRRIRDAVRRQGRSDRHRHAAGYVENGRASALEIQGDVFTAIYTDRRDVLFRLPSDGRSARFSCGCISSR